MTNKLLVYSEKITPRLRYTVATIVGNLLSLNIEFTENLKEFIHSELPKINYSKTPFFDKELFILSSNLLFENTILPYLINSENDFFLNKNLEINKLKLNAEINSELNKNNNLPINLSINSAFDFDIFARIFYLVSRYEEYNLDPSVLDVYQRFSSPISVASKLDFLKQPLVNQYVITLSEKLKQKFPQLEMQLPSYQFQPSFDFDMAWLYKNKGFLRNAGGYLKDLLKGKFNLIKKRTKILRGTQNDPYFTFDLIDELHFKYGLKPVMFWLLGDLAKFDKNIHWQHPEFQELIQFFAKKYRVGIHPSFKSNTDILTLKKEVFRLQKIINFSPNLDPKKPQNDIYTEGGDFLENVQNNAVKQPYFPSRQHFLKLRFPETYRRLIAVGIREDWSMGYADETGFRASIATPFRWFDLEKNMETDLIIHPFQAMDVTLNLYLKLSPEAANERLKSLIEVTKEVGGTFVSLWHNDNLAEMGEWKGWRKVYENLVDDAI